MLAIQQSALEGRSVDGTLALRSSMDLLVEVHAGRSALTCRLSVSHFCDGAAVSGYRVVEIELQDLLKVADVTSKKCLCTGEGAFDCRRACGWGGDA